VKMLIEFFNIHISITISLLVIVVCLLGSVLYSLRTSRPKAKPDSSI